MCDKVLLIGGNDTVGIETHGNIKESIAGEVYELQNISNSRASLMPVPLQVNEEESLLFEQLVGELALQPDQLVALYLDNSSMYWPYGTFGDDFFSAVIAVVSKLLTQVSKYNLLVITPYVKGEGEYYECVHANNQRIQEYLELEHILCAHSTAILGQNPARDIFQDWSKESYNKIGKVALSYVINHGVECLVASTQHRDDVHKRLQKNLSRLHVNALINYSCASASRTSNVGTVASTSRGNRYLMLHSSQLHSKVIIVY